MVTVEFINSTRCQIDVLLGSQHERYSNIPAKIVDRFIVRLITYKIMRLAMRKAETCPGTAQSIGLIKYRFGNTRKWSVNHLRNTILDLEDPLIELLPSNATRQESQKLFDIIHWAQPFYTISL